jgi:hypothetical protein
MAFSAIGAAALIGTTIFQGQRQKKQERKALRRQDVAQQQATTAAAGEQRRSEGERRRLNRRGPDLGSILGGQRRAGQGGAAGTLLTGAGGVGRGQLTLGGGGSLLGG